MYIVYNYNSINKPSRYRELQWFTRTHGGVPIITSAESSIDHQDSLFILTLRNSDSPLSHTKAPIASTSLLTSELHALPPKYHLHMHHLSLVSWEEHVVVEHVLTCDM